MQEYGRQLGVDASTAFMSCLCWWLQVALFLPLRHLFLCSHNGCCPDIHSAGGTTVPPTSARSCCRMVATPSCPCTPTTGKPSSRMGFPFWYSPLTPYCSAHLHPEEQWGEEDSRDSFQQGCPRSEQLSGRVSGSSPWSWCYLAATPGGRVRVPSSEY